MRPVSRALCATAVVVAVGCGGSHPSQQPTPERDVTLHVVNQSIEPITLFAMYGVSPATGLGRVPASGEATYTFFWRAGELRIVLHYLENRKGASNGIVDLRRGDVLELFVRGDGTPHLSRKR
jgi:hypothetical protein